MNIRKGPEDSGLRLRTDTELCLIETNKILCCEDTPEILFTKNIVVMIVSDLMTRLIWQDKLSFIKNSKVLKRSITSIYDLHITPWKS